MRRLKLLRDKFDETKVINKKKFTVTLLVIARCDSVMQVSTQ